VPQSGIQRDGSGVDPIHDQAVEAGVKIGDGTVLWTTSIYVTEREDLTVSDPANGPSESFLVNAGSARIIGVESELAGRVGPDLDLRGGLAVQRSELVENPVPEFDGNQFANTPEFQAGAVASYRWTRLGLERLSTALGVRYMGERYGNSGNTITLPDYVLVDASAAWAFGQGTSLTLNATNLFDETYYTGMQDGNGAGADQVMVGDPRIVSLTCRHRF
jgi:outer membrane receptor protein involved in Fe transport